MGDGMDLPARPTVSLPSRDGNNSRFSIGMASAGDINGDGFADLAVGAYRANVGTGAVYVFRGSPSGIAMTPDYSLAPAVSVSTNFGLTLQGLGDVNGDGYADLAVGAPGGTSDDGRVYVFLGRAAGFSGSPTTTLAPPGISGGNFGQGLGSAGDLNGDGFADLIVGARSVDSRTGRAFVYLGSAGGIPTTPSLTLNAPGAGGAFGDAVSCVGDVNGDGYADLGVAAGELNTRTGAVYLYLGSATGLRATPDVTLDGPDGTGGYFGHDVASAGDLNGDGFGDLVVGAYGVRVTTGYAYVFLGSATGVRSTASVTLVSPQSYGSFFGWSVGSAGDVNGDLLGDLAIGTPGGSTGWVNIYLGSASGVSVDPLRAVAGPDGLSGSFGHAFAH